MSGGRAAEKIELLRYANFVHLVLNDQTERRVSYLFGVAGVLLTIMIGNYASVTRMISATGRYGVWLILATAFTTVILLVRIFMASKLLPFAGKKFYETRDAPNLLFYRYFMKESIGAYMKKLDRADVADEYAKELFDLGNLVRKKNAYLEGIASMFTVGVLAGALMMVL